LDELVQGLPHLADLDAGAGRGGGGGEQPGHVEAEGEQEDRQGQQAEGDGAGALVHQTLVEGVVVGEADGAEEAEVGGGEEDALHREGFACRVAVFPGAALIAVFQFDAHHHGGVGIGVLEDQQAVHHVFDAPFVAAVQGLFEHACVRGEEEFGLALFAEAQLREGVLRPVEGDAADEDGGDEDHPQEDAEREAGGELIHGV